MANAGAFLPYPLQEQILRGLPTVVLLRCRVVCKHWYTHIGDLLSSRPPWLLLISNDTRSSFAYDVDAGEWYRLPKGPSHRGLVPRGCIQGLLVADLPYVRPTSTFYVCDIWTGAWIPLHVCEPFKHIKGFRFQEETSFCTVIGSRTRWGQPSKGWPYSATWLRHVFLPHDESHAYFLSGDRSYALQMRFCLAGFMVERNGTLYGLVNRNLLIVFDDEGKERCLYEDSSKLEGSEETCLNEDSRESFGSEETLLNCGGRLVKVWVESSSSELAQRHVKIYQLCEPDAPDALQSPLIWVVLDIMPAHLLEQLCQIDPTATIECSSAGVSHVCFKTVSSLKILSYNLANGSWAWIPDCPFLPLATCPRFEYRAFGLKVWPRLFPRIEAIANSIH